MTEKDVLGKTVGAGRRYYHPLQKDYATFLETSEETGGDRTLIEVEVAPGGENDTHFHKTYEKHFEVIEGSLEVLVAGKNVLHRFRNPTDTPTRFLVELRPGHAGFEKALKAGYGLAADGLTGSNGAPKNPYHLAVLLEWSEIRMPGIFTVAEPLFRLLAKRARRKGIDARLENLYCR
jgi:mannose-6-phosphate isomerase-like protein (cupin superfamily)